MTRAFLFTVWIAFYGSIAVAEDLRLRITTIGYEDSKSEREDQKETILRTIEAQISPESKFSTRCSLHGEHLVLTGSTLGVVDSSYNIRFRYKYGKLSPEQLAQMEEHDITIDEFLPGTAVESTLTLKPGESQTVGEVQRVTQSSILRSKRYTSTKIVVSLIDLDAERESIPRKAKRRE